MRNRLRVPIQPRSGIARGMTGAWHAALPHMGTTAGLGPRNLIRTIPDEGGYTANGPTRIADQFYGHVWDFDSAHEMILIDDNNEVWDPATSGVVSFAIRFRLDSTDGTRGVVICRDDGVFTGTGWHMYYENGSSGFRLTKDQWNAGPTVADSASGFSLGEWITIYGAMDDSLSADNIYLNVNGATAATTDTSFGALANKPIRIATDGFFRPSNMACAWFCFWKRHLSDGEQTWLMRTPRGPFAIDDDFTFFFPAAGGVTRSPGGGNLVLDGKTPLSINSGDNISRAPGQANLALDGKTPNLVLSANNVSRAPGPADMVLDGKAPVQSTDLGRVPGQGDLVLDGKAPSATVSGGGNTTRAPGQGDMVIDGKAPVQTLNNIAAVPQGDLTIDGKAPAISVGVNRRPGQGDLVLDGKTPNLLIDIIRLIPQGDLVFEGFAPTITTEPEVAEEPAPAPQPGAGGGGGKSPHWWPGIGAADQDERDRIAAQLRDLYEGVYESVEDASTPAAEDIADDAAAVVADYAPTDADDLPQPDRVDWEAFVDEGRAKVLQAVVRLKELDERAARIGIKRRAAIEEDEEEAALLLMGF